MTRRTGSRGRRCDRNRRAYASAPFVAPHPRVSTLNDFSYLRSRSRIEINIRVCAIVAKLRKSKRQFAISQSTSMNRTHDATTALGEAFDPPNRGIRITQSVGLRYAILSEMRYPVSDPFRERFSTQNTSTYVRTTKPVVIILPCEGKTRYLENVFLYPKKSAE